MSIEDYARSSVTARRLNGEDVPARERVVVQDVFGSRVFFSGSVAVASGYPHRPIKAVWCAVSGRPEHLPKDYPSFDLLLHGYQDFDREVVIPQELHAALDRIGPQRRGRVAVCFQGSALRVCLAPTAADLGDEVFRLPGNFHPFAYRRGSFSGELLRRFRPRALSVSDEYTSECLPRDCAGVDAEVVLAERL